MGIDYYIDATRKNRPDRIKPEMYVNRVFPFLEIPVLASQLPRSSIIPLLTFSYSRKVELVECAGSNYLIYDQYMGQTLNALTRFVSEKGGQEGCVIYFFKYASERLLIHGRTEEAFKVAILYKDLKAKSKFFSNPKVDERRAFSVFIQELYLMAHEVYHCVLMLSAELRADAIDHALRFMESRQSGFSKIAIGGTKGIPGQPEDSLMSAVNNLMGVHLEPDEKLALELCCDRLALNLCATVTMSGFGARNLKDALVSCYTAYLFSRTLNFVNLDISRWLSNDSVSEEKSVLESKEMAVHMLRKAYLRKCIFYYSDLGEHPSDSGIDRKDFGLKSDEIFQIMQNREKKVSDNCMDVMMSKTKKITTGDLFKSMDLDVDLTKLNGIDNANSSELVRMAESLLGW